MKIAKFVLPVIAAGLFASSAMAAPNASWSVDDTNTVAGIVANKLTSDGEGIDWTAAVLVVELTNGSVYNGSPNSDRPQDGFWGIPGFDILRWDTYVGIPAGINDVGPLGAGDLGSPALSLTGNLVSVAWGGTGTTNTGPTTIANISLSNDAAGTWKLLTSFAGNVIVQTEGVVEAGAIVPEPASLALLGLGGLAVLRRR